MPEESVPPLKNPRFLPTRVLRAIVGALVQLLLNLGFQKSHQALYEHDTEQLNPFNGLSLHSILTELLLHAGTVLGNEYTT